MKTNHPRQKILLGFSIFILCSSVVYGQGRNGSYIQEQDKSLGLKNHFKPITLNGAIEQGLRQNYDEEQRGKEKEILQLDWKGVKEDFWLPKFTLNLTTSGQRTSTLRRGDDNPFVTPQSPTGTIGISMEDYTVFNWGKDYLEYLNNQENYQRNRTILDEERRKLKHRIIIKYFETYMYQQILKIRKEQLRHASFIYRYNREKVSSRKISKQDYYQSRMSYLSSQSDYHQAKQNMAHIEEELAFLIADKAGTRYVFSEGPRHIKLKMKFDEATAISKRSSPSILDSHRGLQNSMRDYEITLKNNLPLPKFTIAASAYQKTFGRNISTTSSPLDSSIDLVATINATWSLTGTGGLFNSRTTSRSHLTYLLAQDKLKKAKHQITSNIRQHYNNIKYLENQLTILEARTENMQKTFDIIHENYLNKATRFTHFNQALEEMINSQILYQQNNFFHIREKVLLATTVGIEDFPGENFENLVQKNGDRP